jgi:uncharacterized membrane protein YdfJ with MMPL/SSD domain
MTKVVYLLVIAFLAYVHESKSTLAQVVLVAILIGI